MTTLLDAVPADRQDTARAALTTAFGPTAVTSLAPVTGGASGALTYRVEAAGRPYLLRLEPERQAGFRDPKLAYACMTTAVEAGLAPALRHADSEAGVVIMDFIVQRPIDQFPGGPTALVQALGGLTGRLQQTPVFPAGVASYLNAAAYLLGVIRRSSLFAPGALDAHHEGLERLRAAYPWNEPAFVSSHNDPNPRNILFDGQRLWLIDWELSFRNDPYVDLAILADNFAQTPELEAALLGAWRGRAPDDASHARLALMRPLTRLFYAGVILMPFTAAPRETPDGLEPMTSAELIAAVSSGQLSPTGPDMLYVLGKMCLAGFLAGVSGPQFDDALIKVGLG